MIGNGKRVGGWGRARRPGDRKRPQGGTRTSEAAAGAQGARRTPRARGTERGEALAAWGHSLRPGDEGAGRKDIMMRGTRAGGLGAGAARVPSFLHRPGEVGSDEVNGGGPEADPSRESHGRAEAAAVVGRRTESQRRPPGPRHG